MGNYTENELKTKKSRSRSKRRWTMYSARTRACFKGRKAMRRTIISSVLGAFLVSLLTGTGWAMDLQTAKEQGLLGETASGYLALVQNNPEAAKEIGRAHV